MNDSSTPSTLTRWTNISQIVLAMTVLSLPMLDSFVKIDKSRPRDENRTPAAFPHFPTQLADSQAYLSGIESYYNDHFGCRNILMKWHDKLKRRVFKDKSTHKVISGKENWLYFTESRAIEHFTGQLQFTPEQLNDWKMLLEKRRDWLARRGIPYVFVVAPDKHSVYPEYLPAWITKVRPQTKLDQFVAYMKANSTVPVVDTRQAVIDAKSLYPSYLKTDTHWNHFGGFFSYQVLLTAMAKQMPDLKLQPLPLSSFTVKNLPHAGGDLARIQGLDASEPFKYTLIPSPELKPFSITEPPKEHPTVPLLSTNPQAKGKVLFFHDSFAGAWYPYLGYHFNHIDYIWQYELDPAWVEKEKPDLVVTEMLERFLNIFDPKKMMLTEGLD